MSELLLDTLSPVAPLPATTQVPPPSAPRDSLRDALMESRQRWQHLVTLAADLAFETDADGRFTFLVPDTILGRPAESLIGQASEALLGDDAGDAPFNPFRPIVAVRRHQAWLRCLDGRLAMITISAAPLYDAAGHVIGARGMGVDMTDNDAQTSQIAGRLRRGQVLHHILSQVMNETTADSMMDTALLAVIRALGAEGAAVAGAVADDARIEVLHECGPGASAVLETAAGMLMRSPAEPGDSTNFDGRLVLAASCPSRSIVHAGLAIWRGANGRPWDREDKALAESAVCVVRMILEYEAMQREMCHQASTDPLTGLLNRRAFIDETRRQIARLDREAIGGTLLFIDMDAFKAVNDRLGHAIGDTVLVHLSEMLRKLVRPSDLITRMGGDEFAVWLNGADHMTAAERADFLCKNVPLELAAMLPEAFPALGVSIGIATRRTGSGESVEDLLRRADMAMYDVKRGGRRHWRVSLLDGD